MLGYLGARIGAIGVNVKIGGSKPLSGAVRGGGGGGVAAGYVEPAGAGSAWVIVWVAVWVIW